jgi:BirA family biotin operon repressor/biotin-[acetyl-CoA-carboxylase] ligase
VSGLDPARLQALLRTQRYGRSLRLLEVTESTNDDARRDAAAGAADGHVVVADSQQRGRGSHGRIWTSPAGTCLYLSIVARPAVPLAQLPPLTLAVGLGVAEAVERVLEPSVRAHALVKWPNDVWLFGKKCAGILIEASSSGAVLGPLVIGIGLNVNRMDWPEELEALAISLRAARPDAAALDRETTLAELLESVERRVDRFVAEGAAATVAALETRLALRGERVRCDAVEGTLLGVSPSGALRIATEAGVRELIAGRLEAMQPGLASRA